MANKRKSQVNYAWDCCRSKSSYNYMDIRITYKDCLCCLRKLFGIPPSQEFKGTICTTGLLIWALRSVLTSATPLTDLTPHLSIARNEGDFDRQCCTSSLRATAMNDNIICGVFDNWYSIADSIENEAWVAWQRKNHEKDLLACV